MLLVDIRHRHQESLAFVCSFLHETGQTTRAAVSKTYHANTSSKQKPICPANNTRKYTATIEALGVIEVL